MKLPAALKLACLFSLLSSLAACDGNDDETVRVPSENVREGMKLYEQVAFTHRPYTETSLASQLVDRHEDPDQVMLLLDIQSGWTVADIGCGMGYYTFRFARAVGETGRVFGIDIIEQAVSVVQAQAKRADLNPYGNIEVWTSRPDATLLPDDSLDLGFMSHMGWYISKDLLPENWAMLRDTYRAVKPGGLLALLQVRPADKSLAYVPGHFEAVGFVLEQRRFLEFGSSDLFYFRKPLLPVEP